MGVFPRMGGQRELKFHNVLQSHHKETPIKPPKKNQKKIEAANRQYDPHHLKKRKKISDPEESDHIPNYVDRDQEVSDEPINYSLPKQHHQEKEIIDTEFKEHDPELPMDLTMKKKENFEKVVEQDCPLGEPPPLEPIRGRESYLEYMKQISGDIHAPEPFQARVNPVQSLPPLILPPHPPVLLPQNPAFLPDSVLQHPILQSPSLHNSVLQNHTLLQNPLLLNNPLLQRPIILPKSPV